MKILGTYGKVRNTKQINASLRAVPVYRKHVGRAGAWNIFRNNFEEYATTNETDFMGSVTMSPASGRQLHEMAFNSTITKSISH